MGGGSERLKEMMRNYFVDLLGEYQQDTEDLICMTHYPDILTTHVATLEAKESLLEVKTALFDMGPLKVPGEDGFPTLFFQKSWDVVSPMLMQFIDEVWDDPSSIEAVNNMIVLVNKVGKPERVTQFHPITLCNVAYKLLTKIIVNRLKPFLDGIIYLHASLVLSLGVTSTITLLLSKRWFTPWLI